EVRQRPAWNGPTGHPGERKGFPRLADGLPGWDIPRSHQDGDAVASASLRLLGSGPDQERGRSDEEDQRKADAAHLSAPNGKAAQLEPAWPREARTPPAHCVTGCSLCVMTPRDDLQNERVPFSPRS